MTGCAGWVSLVRLPDIRETRRIRTHAARIPAVSAVGRLQEAAFGNRLASLPSSIRSGLHLTRHGSPRPSREVCSPMWAVGWAHEQMDLAKSRGFATINPPNLILGNSRAAIAFDPLSAVWPAPGSTDNAAIRGTGTAASVQSLKAVVAAGELRYVLIGVGFFDFRVDPDDAPRPVSTERSSLRGSLLATTVFSLDALSDSVTTAAIQHREAIADIISCRSGTGNSVTSRKILAKIC